MSRSNCTFTSVSYRYPGTPDPVFENLSFDLHGDWTGIVGENGAGKSTLLLLASKLIAPDRGTVASPSPAHLCLQRTDEPPAEMENFLYSGDNEAMRLMNLLSMDWDWLSRWGSLSHGERKRAQIAVALWLRPELLALDEPTNHLDSGAKELLVRALRTYGGTGLIVSHDRNVLDTLCARCVFLRSGRAVVRPGGVTDGLREEERERKEAERAHTEASRDYERIRKETEARRHIAEGSRNRVSKAGLKRGDKDGRGKINLARVTGKDAVGGRLYAEFESRLEQAERRLEDAKAPPVRKTGVRLGALRSDSDFLFRSEPTELPLGDGKLLRLPALELRPSDRTA